MLGIFYDKNLKGIKRETEFTVFEGKATASHGSLVSALLVFFLPENRELGSVQFGWIVNFIQIVRVTNLTKVKFEGGRKEKK